MAGNIAHNVSPETMQRYLLDDATILRRIVRLHDLCSACRSFGKNVDNRNLPYELCFGSVSRLDPDNCHLCAMIEAFRSSTVSDNNGTKPPEDAIIGLRWNGDSQPNILGTFTIMFSQAGNLWMAGELRFEFINSKWLA